MKWPWQLHKENQVLQAKLDALLFTSEQLLHEKYEALEEMKRIEEWKNNPFALLRYWEIPIQEHNLTKMTEQQQIEYAGRIHDVFTNECYQSEMESFAADIYNKLLNDTKDHNETERNRQLLVFIAGMATRFKQLSALYITNQNKLSQQNNGGTSAIG
jgi:hypothetical protein